jgi:hypothetical protein
MLLLTNQVQEVQMFFVLVQYVINQLLLVPAHHIIILTAFFEIYLSAIISMLFSLLPLSIAASAKVGSYTREASLQYKIQLVTQIDFDEYDRRLRH